MTLGNLTEVKLLVPRLLSRRQNGTLQELIRRLEVTDRVTNATAFMAALARREKEFPTILGEDIAVPHVRGQAARKLSLAVGLSEPGIPWGPGDRVQVHAVFLFAIPLADASSYLSALSALAKLFSSPAYEELKQCTQPETMMRILQRHPLDPVRPLMQDPDAEH